MEKQEKAYEYGNFKCKKVDLDYLLEYLEEFKIFAVELDPTLTIQDRRVLYCDYENPITYSEGFFYSNTLCINEKYYRENKEKIDNLIGKIVRSNTNDKFEVGSTGLINDGVIQAVYDNEKIEQLVLGNNDDIYYLDKRVYDKLHGTHVKSVRTKGVSDELKEDFSEFVEYNNRRNLISFYNYEYLSTTGSIFLSDTLSAEELENLKYLNSSAKVDIRFPKCFNVIEIINGLNKVGHKGSIEINIEKKNDFNNYIFEHLGELKNVSRVTMSGSAEQVDLSTYLKYEKRLLDMVIPALNLSPFERYLYAYNIVKQFKQYKENEEDKQSSRNLYKLLDNEFMVCVGYSHLLGDLLDKLGIENYDYSVAIDIGLDYVPQDVTVLPEYVINPKTNEKQEVKTEVGNHARRKINLVDPKYGIDGYFYADPTWDNDLQHDTYNYALMTSDEYIGIDRYNYFSRYTSSELFFVHSLEEFYQKLNILLDKNPKKIVVDYISSLFFELKTLDSVFYAEMKEKYPNVDSYKLKDASKEEIQNILLELGERIIGKANNFVSGEKYKEAIEVLYREKYGMDPTKVEEAVLETIEYNKKRQTKAFPTRYKVDKNDTEMVVLNAVNKFDLGEEKEVKVA